LKNLIYIDVKDTVKNAIKLMNEKGFSQLPVMDNGQPVGSIREPKFMASVLEKPELIDSPVEKLMGESFPVLDSKTELPVVKDFLTRTTAVLVAEYGRIIDLITRYDLIEFTDNYS
jgi:cystathionine beta-synthase